MNPPEEGEAFETGSKSQAAPVELGQYPLFWFVCGLLSGCVLICFGVVLTMFIAWVLFPS